MKRIVFLLVTVLGLFCSVSASAQKAAKIEFEKTTHNFGSFSEANPKQSCSFKFKNTGNDVLIINQAVASCGCTVADFTKKPIQPGETGAISVTYDGTGKFTGHFKKTVTVRTNATNELVRLYIEGDMTPKKK
ncbi:MAG: DUF1573 domain-containing protein [Bacteroidaceae bacterium]|nr:DUF1573 domain-containing protein [Bacteroidaceae bacterium]